MISVRIVEVNSPPITTRASGRERKDPSLRPRAMGVRARIVATAVMRMGRSRLRPPSMIALWASIPWSRYCSTRSSSTMALVTTIPISMSSPIRLGMPRLVPVRSSRSTAPTAAKGMLTSRISGCSRLRKVPTMMRYTTSIATSMAKPRLRNMSFICSLAPAISQRAPSGSSRSARAVSTSVLVWPTLLETAAAEMVTVRSPSICVIWAGPAASSTVATLDRGTGPAPPIRVRPLSCSEVAAPSVRRGRVILAGSGPSSVGTSPAGIPLRIRERNCPTWAGSRPAAAAFALFTWTAIWGRLSDRLEERLARPPHVLELSQDLAVGLLQGGGILCIYHDVDAGTFSTHGVAGGNGDLAHVLHGLNLGAEFLHYRGLAAFSGQIHGELGPSGRSVGSPSGAEKTAGAPYRYLVGIHTFGGRQQIFHLSRFFGRLLCAGTRGELLGDGEGGLLRVIQEVGVEQGGQSH